MSFTHTKNITSLKHRSRIFSAVCVLMFVISSSMFAQTPVTIYNNFSGTVNYTVIGGSLRTLGNTVDPVAMRASDTSKLSIPSGAAVVGAYLYWAGSGSTADNSVMLDGNTFTASRTFTESYLNGSAWLYFFGGFADVTSYIQSQSNNKTYSFSDLTVDVTGNYLSSQAAIAGWAMVVVYNNPTEVKKSVNIFDGFQIFRGAQITFTPNNFYVPYSLVEGKMTHITWEGDKENSTSLNGYNEEVKFGGGTRTPQSLTDIYNPANNQFGSFSNNFPEDTTFGVDIDTYNITSYLAPRDTQATSIYSSGGDLVILNVEVISIADTANSDIQVTKTHSPSSVVGGSNVTYTLTVQNNGPDTTGAITLYDSLRTGLTFVSYSGSGWAIDSTAKPKYKWTHSGIHPPGWSSSVTLTAYLTAANYPGKQLNTANASSPQFDRKPWNNYSTDSLTILTPYFITSTKTLSDLNGGSVRPGDTLLYTISITNTGNYPATNIAVTDSTPLGVKVVPGSLSPSGVVGGVPGLGELITFNTISSIAISGNSTVQYRVVVDSTVLHGATYTNVAHVKAQTIDQRITSSFVPVNVPKMQIQKFRYTSGTGNGDTLSYYLVVKNTSSFAISANTQIIDTIPNPSGTNANNPYYLSSGTSPSATIASFGTVGNQDTSLTWNIGTSLPGEVDTLKFKMRISSGLANGTSIINKATVLNPAGSRDSSTLAVTKTAPVVTISKFLYPPGSGTGDGDTLQYYIVLTNTSTSSPSTNTTVLDTIPNPVTTNTVGGNAQNPYYLIGQGTPTPTIASFGGGGANNRDTSLTWNIGTMAPGEVDTIKFKMRVSSTLATPTNVRNQAIVTNTQGWRDSSTFVFTKSVFYSAKLWGTRYILPGDSIYYTLLEADTNKNVSSIETLTLRDTNRVATTDNEGIVVTESAANSGLFTGKIKTTYGTSGYTANNSVFIVKPGDSLRISYIDKYDSTSTSLTTGQIRNVWRTFVTKVLNGHAVSLSGTVSIFPTNIITYTVNDSDLNRSSTTIETYTIRDSNQVTGEIENLLFTETGANTGIFTSQVNTVFGTSSNGNNNGSFAVQQGDTITLKYYDSVIVNGSNGGLKTWKTYVAGGKNAVVTATATIYPADTVLVTIIDTDLNKNASIIESYAVRDSNTVTGEVESFTVTERSANDSVFTKKLLSVFGLTAGINHDGFMNVKVGDSLRVTYYDTLLTNGSSGGVKTAGTFVRGGSTATLGVTSPIYPGDSLTITITDKDLNKNIALIETYTVKDSNIVTGEVETFTITERSVNDSVFTKKLGTVFGLVSDGSNNGRFNVKAGDSLRVSYTDTMLTNGGPGGVITAGTFVQGGNNATLTSSGPIYPVDSLLITITDVDLNKNISAVETYTVKDSNIVSGEVETFTITETGVNTGIFTKKLATIFGLTAGTNNDGIFNVKADDSLRVMYRDSLRVNGGDSTLLAYTKILGGVNAAITATTPIIPSDSILITITDADLNKNSSVAETYTVKDSSISTGEVETFTITETGVNTGIFTKKLGTQFGLTAGPNNNGIFNVKADDSLRVTYRDSLQANGGAVTLVAFTRVIGGATALLTANPVIIAANDSSTFTLTDADLNKNAATVQSYVFTVTSTTGESEAMTFTETGINTGIFTKKVPTIFGVTPGGNNTGIFTVQPGDTITVSYLDTLTAIGGTATISAIFRIGFVDFTTSSKSYVDGNGGFVKPPDTLQYTVKVKNSGTVTATNIALKDTLPTDVTILAGTISNSGSAAGRVISWPAFNLAVGDSALYQYHVRVDSSIASQVPSINTATIDGNGIRYQVTASFTPVNRPLMTMTKTANRATAKPGDTIMYTINYSNIGTVPAALVTVSDVQPDNTTYVPNSVKVNSVAKTDASDADEVTLTGITVQLNLGVIPPGASGTVTMKVRVN